MIDFISREAFRLAPYTPGEQPQNQEYIKLNTNFISNFRLSA